MEAWNLLVATAPAHEHRKHHRGCFTLRNHVRKRWKFSHPELSEGSCWPHLELVARVVLPIWKLEGGSGQESWQWRSQSPVDAALEFKWSLHKHLGMEKLSGVRGRKEDYYKKNAEVFFVLVDWSNLVQLNGIYSPWKQQNHFKLNNLWFLNKH